MHTMKTTKRRNIRESYILRLRKLDSAMLVTSSITFKVKHQSLVFGVQTGNQPSAVVNLYACLMCSVLHQEICNVNRLKHLVVFVAKTKHI